MRSANILTICFGLPTLHIFQYAELPIHTGHDRCGIEKSKEDFILHFRSAYTDDYPPAWMITLQDLHEPER